MKNKLALLLTLLFALPSCKFYSFTGVSINAKNISIQEFYNNTDLGPANLGITLTNQLKNYFQQNSSLSVIKEEGELQMEGIITDFKVSQVAPTASQNPNQISSAALSRLTIVVKVTYTNTLDETMSFKDKSFSFFKDFPNEQNLSDVQDDLTKQIFDQIILDIFNASVANW
ncbi:MAG: LPS assembly lipoprotein LptE [Flammeovirgaceae bacterium]|nr:LPS assembly lipoprotein LptE [Flammeovirgaceae bacterium]